MPLPHVPGRLEFMAETRNVPPSPRGRLEAGYIDRVERGYPGATNIDPVPPVNYVRVTQVRLKRNFVFLVNPDDVRAIFIPNSPTTPLLEEGKWYFGPTKVSNYIDGNSSANEGVVGILYVKSDALIRWQIEGVSPVAETREVIRPLFAPNEFSPIEFQEIIDGPGHDCDAD